MSEKIGHHHGMGVPQARWMVFCEGKSHEKICEIRMMTFRYRQFQKKKKKHVCKYQFGHVPSSFQDPSPAQVPTSGTNSIEVRVDPENLSVFFREK